MPTNPIYPAGNYPGNPLIGEASPGPSPNEGLIDQDGQPNSTSKQQVKGAGSFQDYRKLLHSRDSMYASNGQIMDSYGAAVEYVRDEGRYVYPVAGTDSSGSQAGVVVQEYCPVESAVVTWTASSSFGPPRVPPPVLADRNFLLRSRSIGLPTPVIGSSGTVRRWVVAGVYSYQMITPGAVIRDFPGLGNALDITPRAQNTMPANRFDPSLTF